ncbi:MAG: hypothetical protein ACTSQE_04870 [Candidatus Heimdallarchaeaceae archaeon]
MKRFVTPPAILVYITDIIHGMLEKNHENPFQVTLFTKNKEQIERVRIIGTIVNKYYTPGDEGKKAYTLLTLDDGSETIDIKGWELDAEDLNEFEVGDQLEVIGKPRGKDGDIYISSEIISKITNFDKEIYLRTLRTKRYLKKELTIPKTEVHEESENSIAAKRIVLSTILEESNGISMEQILERTKLERADVESVIQLLIQNGDIYEPRRYFFKKV